MKDKPTLKQITEMAKKVMLENGSHIPQLMVRGSKQGTIAVFPDFPDTHEERAKAIAFAGYKVARTPEIGELEEIFFISEAWMAKYDKNDPDIMPRNNPDKVEVLIIVSRKFPNGKDKMIALEIKRDKKDKVINLEVCVERKGVIKAESPLINAFQKGYEMGQTHFN